MVSVGYGESTVDPGLGLESIGLGLVEGASGESPGALVVRCVSGSSGASKVGIGSIRNEIGGSFTNKSAQVIPEYNEVRTLRAIRRFGRNESSVVVPQ